MDARPDNNDDLRRQVQACIQRYLAEQATPEVVFLGEGDFCTAFLVAGHLVVRVGKHAKADAALQRESSLLPQLAPLLPLPIPLPSVLPERTREGHVIAIHEQIEGGPLLPEVWSAFPAEARARSARELGDFLSRLHRVAPADARAWGAEPHDHAGEARWLRERMRSLSDGVLPPVLRRRTDELLRRYQGGGELWSFRPALVHADLSPEHVLFDPVDARLTGVIDWGDARIADPARDFVYLYEDWGKTFLDAVLAHYALEVPDRLEPRIHLQFVIVHVDWIVDASRTADTTALQTAAATLERALDDLDADLARSSA